jgi:hypothetical protein
MTSDKRIFTRYGLRGNIPGTIRSGGKSVEILVVDLSQEGLGLMLDPAPKVGDVINLEIDQPRTIIVPLTVIWSRDADNVPGLNTMKRCGLKCNDASLDLVEIFSKLKDIQIDR